MTKATLQSNYFWTDREILEWQPELRLLYLFFLSCPELTRWGIYSITIDEISEKTGLKTDFIVNGIYILEKRKKIVYDKDTKEIGLINWFVWNGTQSARLKDEIIHGLENVKSDMIIPQMRRINSYLKKPVLFDNLDIGLPPELDELKNGIWQEWKDECKSNGYKLTERSEKLQLKRLLGFKRSGYDIIEIINRSIEHRWRTFYEPKRNYSSNINKGIGRGNRSQSDFTKKTGLD